MTNLYVKWGFLRESAESATGYDRVTGINRTGLDKYLGVIFPKIHDWIHDKPMNQIVDGKKCKIRPDYRSDSLRLVVEFDGIQHYQSPARIRRDEENTRIYETLGYKVVRIPYFIQLTNDAVKHLFGVVVKEPLFDVKFPSLGLPSTSTPAFLCDAGIERMAREFVYFPKQYEVNLKSLKDTNDDFLTGVSQLEAKMIQVRRPSI